MGFWPIKSIAKDMIQSNVLEWIALGPDYEYPLRHSIHLSMFYTLHCLNCYDAVGWAAGRASGL